MSIIFLKNIENSGVSFKLGSSFRKKDRKNPESSFPSLYKIWSYFHRNLGINYAKLGLIS